MRRFALGSLCSGIQAMRRSKGRTKEKRVQGQDRGQDRGVGSCARITAARASTPEASPMWIKASHLTDTAHILVPKKVWIIFSSRRILETLSQVRKHIVS